MKKLFLPAIVTLAFLAASCHYGKNEAQQTLELNEQYKTEKVDYSINKAGERGKRNAPTEAAPADSTK